MKKSDQFPETSETPLETPLSYKHDHDNLE